MTPTMQQKAHDMEAHLRELLMHALAQMSSDPRRNDNLNQQIRDALAQPPLIHPTR